MFRQLDFRSFFNFLGRNRLYAAINIFGLSVSLMFVILIADYTLRQFTCDNYHTKGDRICVIGSEESLSSGYYLQKYLRDRYPEIESTCAVSVSGQSTNATQPIEIGQQKYTATVLFADTTFFRMFDFELLEGDRTQALASRENVVLSESFARKAFGTFNPMGQTIRFPDEEKTYVVSGVVRDIDRSVIPGMDIIMRAERLCDINSSNNERMSNCGAVTTFLLVKEGADLQAKIPDMLAYFKEMYWPYMGNVRSRVTLTPLRDAYFSPLNDGYSLRHGSWAFVMILFGVGAVILLFAVMNYINLTVAQTGFRAKEMAAGASFGLPLWGYSGMPCIDENSKELLFGCRWLLCNEGFIPAMRMRLVAGRNFTPAGNPLDAIVNETYVRMRGWSVEEALGRQITDDGSPSANLYTIVGVVKDFRTIIATGQVEPIVVHPIDYYLKLGASADYIVDCYLMIRLREMSPEALAAVQRKIEEYPSANNHAVRVYDNQLGSILFEIRSFRNIVFSVSGITLLIALMGLVGYLGDEMRRRSKEIALRKVNGASTSDVLRLLARDVLWVVLPSIVAGVVLSRWGAAFLVSNFVERAPLHWWLFALCGLAVVLIVCVVQLVRTWRIANANPIDMIKTE